MVCRKFEWSCNWWMFLKELWQVLKALWRSVFLLLPSDWRYFFTIAHETMKTFERPDIVDNLLLSPSHSFLTFEQRNPISPHTWYAVFCLVTGGKHDHLSYIDMFASSSIKGKFGQWPVGYQFILSKPTKYYYALFAFLKLPMFSK